MPETKADTTRSAAIDMESWVCPAPLRDSPNILMGHGGGGAMSAELIEHLFLPAFGPAADAGMGDSAVVDIGGARLAFSTDSFVVKPMVFPGGTIGDLAVNGTVNDLAMAGARPMVMSTAFILEEGTPLDEIARVAQAVGHRGDGRRGEARDRRHQGGRLRSRRRRVHQHRGHRPGRRACRHPPAAGHPG